MYPADMLRVVVTALLAFSIIALLLTSALHVATFFSTHLGGIPRYFGFHFGVIALWILVVLIYRAKGETIRPNALPQWSSSPWCKSGFVREKSEVSTDIVCRIALWRWARASSGRSKRGCGSRTQNWHRRRGIPSTRS